MRIFTYLMEHKLAFVAVVLCFVIQACCELALPRYTSDIVDVGIQQSGIENQARYRMKTIPAAGALLREEDSREKQATFEV